MNSLNLKNKIAYTIAKLDAQIIDQLDLIILDPSVQKLLSLWTELFLLASTAKSTHITLKFLDITLNELDSDLNTSLDFSATKLYDVIYEQELGTVGGDPFSLLLLNESLNLQRVNTLSMLSTLGELATFALTPLLINISAATFSHDTFQEITDYENEIKQVASNSWSRLRNATQARFIFACLPSNTLQQKGTLLSRNYSFSISINTATLLTMRTIESFQQTHWFSEILGFFELTALMNDGRPLLKGYEATLNCDVYLKKADEQALTHFGVLPLIQQKDGMHYFAHIYSMANLSESVALLLEHMLCACRFGHYIKLLARQKIGSFMDAAACEVWLERWLSRYTATNASSSQHYRYPLKFYHIKLSDIPGKIGYYHCQILLEPHMKLENLNAQIVLNSEILKPQQ